MGTANWFFEERGGWKCVMERCSHLSHSFPLIQQTWSHCDFKAHSKSLQGRSSYGDAVQGKRGALCEPRVWCRCVCGDLEPTAWVWRGMAALCGRETVPTATSAVGSPKPPSSPWPPRGCPSAITPYMGELSWFNTSLRQRFTF